MIKSMIPNTASGRVPRALAAKISVEQALANVRMFCAGQHYSSDPIADLIAASPQAIPKSPTQQLSMYFRKILRRGQAYNVVWAYGWEIYFPGENFTWGGRLSKDDFKFLTEMSGAMIRPNPVTAGTGNGGTIRDQDVLHHDYILIESDVLPLKWQAKVLLKLIRLGLPIHTAVSTGGKSIHALVYAGAKSSDRFRKDREALFEQLRTYGFDMSVGNPSRLTRIPGSMRHRADGTANLQTLLYVA